jgi:hypothetical protein
MNRLTDFVSRIWWSIQLKLEQINGAFRGHFNIGGPSLESLRAAMLEIDDNTIPRRQQRS